MVQKGLFFSLLFLLIKAVNHYGYSESEFLDMTLTEIRPPEDIAKLKQAPISSAILGLQFFRRGNLIIGNEELTSWLLSPVGVTYILLAASLMLTGWLIPLAGIFQIITDDLYGRRIKFKRLFTRIIGRFHQLY